MKLIRTLIDLDPEGTTQLEGFVIDGFHGMYVHDGVLWLTRVKQSSGLTRYVTAGTTESLVLARGIERDADAAVLELLADLNKSTAFELLAFKVLNCKARGGIEFDLVEEKGGALYG
ncbi:hypothetical protein D3C87_1376240 [compost metagenome]